MREVLKDAEDRMKKALATLDKEFARLRTGRASNSLLDGIRVDYYGTPTPLDQIASISTPDSRSITIQPWDRKAFGDVEKAILKSDLGLTPVNDGKIIRISIPPLTEDRRKDLVKVAKKYTEEAKVAMTMERITSFMPGQMPPQVTMATFVLRGSKNRRARGPASSKKTGAVPSRVRPPRETSTEMPASSETKPPLRLGLSHRTSPSVGTAVSAAVSSWPKRPPPYWPNPVRPPCNIR